MANEANRTTPLSTSTDAVLRCYAPPMIAESWRRANTGTGELGQTVGRFFGFVTVVLRYTVGVLAGDAVRLGIEPGPEYSYLIRKMEFPSLGDWSKAGNELATAIVDSGKAPAIREAVSFWRESRRRARPSDASRALQKLVEMRNEIAHDGESLQLNPAEAKRYFDRMGEPLNAVANSLRWLRRYPMLYIDRSEPRRDAKCAVTVLRFSGREVESKVYSAFRDLGTVPVRTPFLVGNTGSVVFLEPFVAVGHFPNDAELSARVLLKYDAKLGAFLYSDLYGGEPAPVHQDSAAPSPWASPENLLSIEASPTPFQVSEETAAAVNETADDQLPKLTNYSVEVLIGRGASGSVFRGRERLPNRADNGRLVALKVLHKAVMADPQQRRRLRKEYDIMCAISQSHTGIARVYSYEEEDGVGPLIAMEWIEGCDLDREVAGRGLPPQRAVTLCKEVLRALAPVHQRGIVHRDIKPGNILLDTLGHTRIIDFGIALAAGHTRFTRQMEAVGTMMFAAPEQRAGLGAVDHRADIYSVGRLLEFLVTGKVGSTGHPNDGLPAGIRAIVRRATQDDPNHRFQSAMEMVAALEERENAKFGGAPVAENDRLNESFEIHKLEGALGGGLWVFSGAELLSDEHVSVVVAETSEPARQRLREAMRNLPDTVRTALHWRGLQQTSDRINFGVFAERDVFEIALQAFADRDFRPVSHQSHWRIDFPLPEYLNGYAHAEMRNPIEIFKYVEVFGSVLLAQLLGRTQMQPDYALWREATSSLGSLYRALEAGKGNLPEALLKRLARLVALRNQYVHSQTPQRAAASSETGEVVSHGLATLKEVGRNTFLFSRQIEPRALKPWLCRADDGAWALLQMSGSKLEYVTLDPERAPVEIEGLADDLLRSAVSSSLTGAEIQRKRSEQARKIFEEVEAELPLRSLGLTVCHNRQLAQNLVADAYVEWKEGERAFAVMLFNFFFEEQRNEALLPQLWKLAQTAGSPFAALTDGGSYWWFRVNPDQGLVRLKSWMEVEIACRKEQLV